MYLRYYGYDPTQKLTASIYIDINGQKPPNIWGKDIFAFDYRIRNFASGNGQFAAWGSSYTRDNILIGTSGCHKEGEGSYCAGLIMKDGWKILDDYPWN